MTSPTPFSGSYWRRGSTQMNVLTRKEKKWVSAVGDPTQGEGEAYSQDNGKGG